MLYRMEKMGLGKERRGALTIAISRGGLESTTQEQGLRSPTSTRPNRWGGENKTQTSTLSPGQIPHLSSKGGGKTREGQPRSTNWKLKSDPGRRRFCLYGGEPQSHIEEKGAR